MYGDRTNRERMLIIFTSCNSVILNHCNRLCRFSALLPFSFMHYHYLLPASCPRTNTRAKSFDTLRKCASEKVKETPFPLRILFFPPTISRLSPRCFSLYHHYRRSVGRSLCKLYYHLVSLYIFPAANINKQFVQNNASCFRAHAKKVER